MTLGGVADRRDGYAAIQRNLNRLVKGAEGNLVKFNKRKCKVLHLQRNNPVYQYTLGLTNCKVALQRRTCCGG